MNLDQKESFGKKTLKILLSDKYGAMIIVILFAIILTIATKNFLTFGNITTLLRQSSFYIIVVLGILLVFMGGGIDLSVGGTMCLAGMGAAALAQNSVNIPLIVIIVVVIIIGAVIGALNGFLVGYLQMPAFIESLGMSILLGGLALVITRGKPINGLSTNFTKMGTGYLLKIPIPIWIAAFMCLIVWFILNKTKYGRHLTATGGNEQAAIVSGINVKKTRFFSYVLCGIFAAISGMVLCARFSSGQLSLGDGYNMNSIAAAVIGGASMLGGSGTVIGAIFGSLVLTVLTNGMDLLSINGYWQEFAQGLIIILAVLLDVARNKLKKIS